jgi:deoxyribodipyrimidine photo-lyase
MKSVIWFRNDLRIDDNPAMRAACNNSDEVHAIFLYSQEQLEHHNEANVKLDFLIDNLKCLSDSLEELNIPLSIIDSKGFYEDPEIILKTSKERDVDKVFFNKQFGEDEQRRDIKVTTILRTSNIEVESFNDQIVYEAGSIRTGQDNPYSVFTPFKRKWVENFDMEFLDIEHKYTPMAHVNISSNISSFNFDFEREHKVDMSIWPAGEQAALDRLKNFLENKASNYSKDRNDPIIDGTSRMSPYLALGSHILQAMYS